MSSTLGSSVARSIIPTSSINAFGIALINSSLGFQRIGKLEGMKL